MKRFVSVLLFAAEIAAVYLWQFRGIEAAGRIVIFYLWALTAVMCTVGVLALIGAMSMKSRKPFPRDGVIARGWSWATLIVRLGILVAICHPALAYVHLFSQGLLRFAIALYRDLPEGGELIREGV